MSTSVSDSFERHFISHGSRVPLKCIMRSGGIQRMRKLVMLCSGIVFVILTLSAACRPSPDLGARPQTFGTWDWLPILALQCVRNSISQPWRDASFTYHVIDPLTGAGARLTGSIEGAVSAGFDGHATGFSSPANAKSLFVGGGPHIALESPSRYVPWVQLAGGFGSFGTFTRESKRFWFMGRGRSGRAIDIGPISWRVQGDYLGTHFKAPARVQSN